MAIKEVSTNPKFLLVSYKSKGVFQKADIPSRGNDPD